MTWLIHDECTSESEELAYEYGARFDDVRERFGDTDLSRDAFDDEPWVPESWVDALGFNLCQAAYYTNLDAEKSAADERRLAYVRECEAAGFEPLLF